MRIKSYGAPYEDLGLCLEEGLPPWVILGPHPLSLRGWWQTPSLCSLGLYQGGKRHYPYN